MNQSAMHSWRGAISILEGNAWTLGGRGLSGTIKSILVHDGTLFVGTSTFSEVT